MTERRFTDEQGIDWRVRVTTPTARVAPTLPAGFQDGWLTFESGAGESRRLAPVPNRWELVDDFALAALCRAAAPARRIGAASGVYRAIDSTPPDATPSGA
jgi:hypothetical protein